MNKILLSTAMLTMMASLCLYAAQNEVLKVSHGGIHDYLNLAEIDSVYFDASGNTLYVQPLGEGQCLAIARADIEQITPMAASDCPSKVLVNFAGSTATIDNPFALSGVSVQVDGAYVTLTNSNTTEEYATQLTGQTTDGALTYYGSYKTTIELCGVELTSQRGAALDIQCGKRVALELKKETTNALTDMANGSQKAALYCKGHLEIDKSGTLNVTGKTAHAISAKEYIKLKKSDGQINILSAVKDGIHCQQYFMANGFNLNIQGVGDDGIQAEVSGEANDEGITDGSILYNGGSLTLVNATNGSTENNESHTAKGMNAEGDMQLNAGTINIKMTGSGGKGIKVAGIYTQGTEDGEGPTLTVSTTGSSYSTSGSTAGNNGGWGGWNRPGGGGGFPGGGSSSSSSAKAIKVQGKATIYGGTTQISTSSDGAEGLESKTGILIKGGSHYLKCYDDCINSSGIVEFAGGNTVCYGYGNDAVDSNYGRKGAITLSGGNVFAYSTKGSPEEGLDCDNNSYIVITGGIAISAGGSQGGGGGWGGGWGGNSSSQSVGSSSQGYYLGSSPSSYAASTYYTLCNTSGEALCTYRFEASVSNSLSLLTAPNLGKGSVTVKKGTAAPTTASAQVCNVSGTPVFFIAPTVTTTATTATVTAK